MKKVLFFVSLFVLQQLSSQVSESQKCNCQISESVNYDSPLIEWVWDGVWLFNDNVTTQIPYEYTETKRISKIDSVASLKIIITYKNIVNKVKVFCTSNEDFWEWKCNHWSFKGIDVDFPPVSYEKHLTMHSSIEEWEVGDKTKILGEEYKDIIEYYIVKDGWTWDADKMIWLYENRKMDINPISKLEKTVTKVWH